jgi:hypothetical protein
LVTILILGPYFGNAPILQLYPTPQVHFLKGKMGMDAQDQSLKFERGVTTNMGKVTLDG